MFVIQRTDVPLYYNEESESWVGLDDASYYESVDGELPDAPCAYTTLWAIDHLQFARLLSEIHMVMGVEGKDLELLCESMELDPDQVQSLFERALEFWEQSKEKF